MQDADLVLADRGHSTSSSYIQRAPTFRKYREVKPSTETSNKRNNRIDWKNALKGYLNKCILLGKFRTLEKPKGLPFWHQKSFPKSLPKALMLKKLQASSRVLVTLGRFKGIGSFEKNRPCVFLFNSFRDGGCFMTFWSCGSFKARWEYYGLCFNS